jgi:ferritin
MYPMQLTSKMRDALNTQMTFELQSAYEYFAMSAWYKSQNLEGFAGFMQTHGTEEMGHAQKIYNYVFERLATPEFGALAKPKAEYESPIDAMQTAFGHELEVTRRVHALVDLARDEKDKATEGFLQWFVQEQVEEEALVDEIISQLKQVGDFAPGLFFLDREMSSRGAAAPQGN